MSNIFRMKDREPTAAELNSLTEQRDRMVIETICRTLGKTDFALAEMYLRGKWLEYADGELLFSFDGKEKFLISPPLYIRETNQYVQKVQWLFDKEDYTFTPSESDIDGVRERGGNGA